VTRFVITEAGKRGSELPAGRVVREDERPHKTSESRVSLTPPL
jgi:hypothetical protein